MGAERYVLLGKQGSDATGLTYLALESDLDRRVRYRVLPPRVARDRTFRGSFDRRLAKVAALEGAGSLQVLDYFMDGDSAVVVTEYFRGASLRAVLNTSGRVTGAQALRILKGVLVPLVDAHAHKVLHRDVHPGYVLATLEGEIKLDGFGQGLASLGRNGGRTAPGGVARYMSPERLAGGAVDQRADVYSCGVLLFEMLTGVPAYDGETGEAIADAQQNRPVWDPRSIIPDVPAGLAILVRRAMAIAPAERQQTSERFLNEVDAVAMTAYGQGWEGRLTLVRLVGAAVAAAPEDIELGEGVQEIESAPPAPPGVSRWAILATVLLAVLVLAGAAGAAYSRGVFGARNVGVASLPSPDPPPSPEASPSTSPVSSPSPVPSLVPSPPPAPPNDLVSINGARILFAPCGSSPTNCGSIVDASLYDEAHPFDGSGYRYLKLMYTYSWAYTGGTDVQNVTVRWEPAVLSGTSGSYPGAVFDSQLARPSGTIPADLQRADIVASADSPSLSKASFALTYTDRLGLHTLRSATLFWTH